MTRLTFAVGDVHGMRAPLEELIVSCLVYAAGAQAIPKFVFVGDYVDRGPDSKGVVDFLMSLSGKYECVFLRGNHEDMLLHDFENCLFNGGRATFGSYGWDDCTDYIMDNPVKPSLSMLPPEHLHWFRATKLWYQDELRSYCHAGIYRHLGGVDKQSDRVLLWVRHEFLDDYSMNGGYVVHGHTPMENGVDVNERPNRCNVDTGSCFGGRLSAAVFNEEQVGPVNVIQVDCSKKGRTSPLK